MDFLHHVYFKNTVGEYLIAAGIITVGALVVNLFKRVVLKRLKKWAEKTESRFDDYLLDGFERFLLPIVKVVIFYVVIKWYLFLTPSAKEMLKNALTVALTFYTVRLVTRFFRIALETYIGAKKEGGEERVLQMRGITIVINIIVWALGIVFLFDNLGYDVTAIITGLGIGGLAVALAAQTILGDLFNYFVIFFDRPFEIGDFIVVDTKRGTVEYIGIKTTRLKSLSGEQIIISNSDLTTSRLHNFKRMEKRRVSFTLGVTYQTPAKKLRQIPSLINTIIEAQEDAEVFLCRFAAYGDFSLNFEVIYYVTRPEYDKYMEVQQDINLRIFEVFEEHKIDFAYPTQTLFVNKGE